MELQPTPYRAKDPETGVDISWRTQAECRNDDPELFFPTGEKENSPVDVEKIRQAKLICQACKVADMCLEIALSRNEKFGIWGGKTPKERQGSKGRSVNNTT